MHASQDVRLMRFLDGLSLSFSMLEHAQAALHTVCSKLTTDKTQVPVAFWLAWSFVDAVHRVRELSQAVPGLGGKCRERQVFLEATADAQGFRNYIQHLREGLSGQDHNSVPVWGVLAWVDPIDPQISHIALSGSQVGPTQYRGCVFDTVNEQYVSKVCLTVDGISFNFDPIFAACMCFRDFVIPWILQTYTPGVRLSEELPVVSMRFPVKVSCNAHAGDVDSSSQPQT